ncbi:MAG TPA: hypothetical protein VL967_12715 [Terracidiphilus sp.]|nr:hypothetical protein [Terracidiphilus sp.]
MPRREPWQLEIDDSMRREVWRTNGPNRPVKVCPAEWTIDIRLGGYITLGKYLIGKKPNEMERDLGLPTDFLIHGARIYKFSRLPQPSEYEYELTADFPDGLADLGPSPRKAYYPPGSPKIHQWRIVSGKSIPVEPRYYTVRPGRTLPVEWLSAL